MRGYLIFVPPVVDLYLRIDSELRQEVTNADRFVGNKLAILELVPYILRILI